MKTGGINGVSPGSTHTNVVGGALAHAVDQPAGAQGLKLLGRGLDNPDQRIAQAPGWPPGWPPGPARARKTTRLRDSRTAMLMFAGRRSGSHNLSHLFFINLSHW